MLVIASACSARTGTDDRASVTSAALSIDAAGRPRLLQAANVGVIHGLPVTEAARGYVERLAPVWGVTAPPVLEPVGAVPVPGGTIVRLRQVIDGMPIETGELRVLVATSGELSTIRGTLIGTTTRRRRAQPVDDQAGAIARAARHAQGSPDVELAVARRAWSQTDDGLVATWIVDAYTSSPTSTVGDAHRTVIDDSGRVLSQRSLVADAAYQYRVWADATDKFPFDGPLADSTPHVTGTPDRSYPAYAPSQLVTVDGLNHPAGIAGSDPWLPVGATETLGNNVEAYADFNAPSGLTFGDFRATVTSTGSFDRTYDTSIGALDSASQQMAGVTSLFYVINWLHDFWYDAGFVEGAGNAQDNNYGRGGQDRDAMLAEAQDNALGGSRNNANMSTPVDGMPPRMQVYVWSGNDNRTLEWMPSGRVPLIGIAAFGPKGFAVSGALVLATDGDGVNVNDACTPLTNTVTGMVVLADRGNCTYKTKALNVQTAGGLGVVIANHMDSTSPPSMGDDATITTEITIPLFSITKAEGETVKAELGAGPVSARLQRDIKPDLEGALDASLIAHEFGHYLHHRLSDCSTRMCSALSEGWADFTALLSVVRPEDDLTGAFPITVYASQSLSNDPAYFGIRRAPYSIDPAINALSFRHMADDADEPTTHPWRSKGNNAEVHNAGEVWAAALWEGYVALQQAGTSFDETRAKMARYVVAGLLLAPVDASPTETRDAILAAVLTASPADHGILAAAFARRGLGSCAVSPPRTSTDFIGITESMVVGGNAAPGAVTLVDSVVRCDLDGILDAGETALVTVPLTNHGSVPVMGATVSLTTATPGVTVMTAPIMVPVLAPYTSTELTFEVSLDASVEVPTVGDLAIVVEGGGACGDSTTLPLQVRLHTDDRAAEATTDTFDTDSSVWTANTTAVWSLARETPIDGLWRGAALGRTTDASLISPPLAADATTPVTLTFSHRYSFEHSEGIAWDGGVIEYSINGGETWDDIMTLANPSYPGTVTTTSGNVLGGRAAFIGASAQYPAMTTTTIDLGTALADQTFYVRFRIGTDDATGAPGWDIDDVAFTGITGAPFPAQVADSGDCGGGPDAGADEDLYARGGACAGSFDTGGGLGLALIALLRRRRTRR